jgi:DNA-binding LacI/PurR family transcriptional regulator
MRPIEAMGRMVIDLLMRQMSGAAVPADEYFFEPELVVRGSTAPARAAALAGAPSEAASA